MPTSTYMHIVTVVRFLQNIMPASILDIGLGNGKMGFIARDLLDVMIGQRHRKDAWKVRIDGIEIFQDYIQDHQEAIYDDIYIGDAFEVIDTLGTYDLIILGDVLEHLPKEKAWRFLDKCVAHCNNHLMINIPLGEKWTQPVIYGNPHEEHLSFWSSEEFEPFVTDKELLYCPGLGYYGCLLIKKSDYIHHRLREEADNIYSRGMVREAISYLSTSLSGIPPDIRSEFVLVDLLLKGKKIHEAINRLKTMTDLFPEDISAKVYLEKVSCVVKEKDMKDINE